MTWATPSDGLRRVILESPYAGDIVRNTDYARRCVRDSVMRGEAPIASHLLFTQPGILRDELLDERTLGIAAGLAWLPLAEAMVVYVDNGISPGMSDAMHLAYRIGVPVERRSLVLVEVSK